MRLALCVRSSGFREPPITRGYAAKPTGTVTVRRLSLVQAAYRTSHQT